MGILGWFRRRNTHMQSAVIQNAPLPLLEAVYSDSQVKAWEEKQRRMAHTKANAQAILSAQAQFHHDRTAIALAQHAFGMGKISLDQDASRVRKLLAERSQVSNAQGLLGEASELEARIRGQIGGY